MNCKVVLRLLGGIFLLSFLLLHREQVLTSFVGNLGAVAATQGQISSNTSALIASVRWFDHADRLGTLPVVHVVNWGTAHDLLGDELSAIRVWGSRKETAQAAMEFLWARGWQQERQGRIDLAVLDYEKAVKVAPESPYAALRLAEAYINLKQFGQATPLLQQAIRSLQLGVDLETLARAHVDEARILRARGDCEGAVATLERAAGLRPGGYEAYYLLGVISLECLNNLDKAEWAFRRASDIQPENSWPLLYIGIIQIRRGEFSLAERTLQTGLRYGPENPAIHEQLGHLYFRLGQPLLAVNHFSQAIRLGREQAWAYRELGQAYEQLGDRKAAIEAYQKALDLEPGDAESQNRIDYLTGRSNDRSCR